MIVLERRPTDPFELRASQEGALNAASWVFLRSRVREERRAMVDRGLQVVQKLIEAKPDTALTHYWDAVFTTYDCRLQDEGRVLPNCFLRTKNTIIDKLKLAMRLDSRVDGYGAHRLYGVMLREMSPSIGGDRATSELYLREALQGAPNYSVNTIELARTLIAANKTTDARDILLQLLSYSCMSMNPFRSIECEEDRLVASDLMNQLSPL